MSYTPEDEGRDRLELATREAAYYPSVDQDKADDGTYTYTLNHPHGQHVAAIEHDHARVAVYWHSPLDGSPAYLVVEIDSAEDDPDLRVYLNDAPVHTSGTGKGA